MKCDNCVWQDECYDESCEDYFSGDYEDCDSRSCFYQDWRSYLTKRNANETNPILRGRKW